MRAVPCCGPAFSDDAAAKPNALNSNVTGRSCASGPAISRCRALTAPNCAGAEARAAGVRGTARCCCRKPGCVGSCAANSSRSFRTLPAALARRRQALPGRRERARGRAAWTLDHMPRVSRGQAVAGELAPSTRGAFGACSGRRLSPAARADNAAGAVAVSAYARVMRLFSLARRACCGRRRRVLRPTRSARCTRSVTQCPTRGIRWGVLLSAASSLAWWAASPGRAEAELLAEKSDVQTTTRSSVVRALSVPHGDVRRRDQRARRARRILGH